MGFQFKGRDSWIFRGWDIKREATGFHVYRMPFHSYRVATFREALRIAERFGYCA